MAIDSALQDRVNSLLDPLPAAEDRDTQFSPFRLDHRDLATGLAVQLDETATKDGLEKAIAQAEGGMDGALPGAVKQAVKQLVTHHPDARGVVTVPAVQAIPLDAAPAAPGIAADDVIPVPNPETEPVLERALDWYREDPLANDHHGHWHQVYPSGGWRGRTQPRQGELFFYMHQQMLARYATERAIAGLPPVATFEPLIQGGHETYTAPIPEGYGLPAYTARGTGERLHDLTLAQDGFDLPVEAMTKEHAVITKALREGKIGLRTGGSVPLTESFLGAIVESSTPRKADDSATLDFIQTDQPFFHGMGHVLVSAVVPPQAGDRFQGPMAYFETAISDPFFYRWHGHIDDIYAAYQDKAGPNAYDAFAADVKFTEAGGKPDIALVLSRDIPGADAAGFDFHAFGPQAFAEGSPATDKLITRFVPTRAVVTAGGGEAQTIVDNAELLNHEPFVVFLRIHNNQGEKQDVTVRLFLAHTDLADDRRKWVELDKFKATLQPGGNVVAQPDARSSVIKRKGVGAPGADTALGGEAAWCDCGWPFSLLLPSGASDAQGTKFHLMAAVTSWKQDEANKTHTCTSMSFCGAEDGYPDKRNMGYPFDRKFPDAGVLATIAAQKSMTMRDFAIGCETPRPT